MVCCNTEVQCKLQADLADVTLNQDQEANDVIDQKPPGGDEIPKAVQEGENEKGESCEYRQKVQGGFLTLSFIIKMHVIIIDMLIDIQLLVVDIEFLC